MLPTCSKLWSTCVICTHDVVAHVVNIARNPDLSIPVVVPLITAPKYSNSVESQYLLRACTCAAPRRKPSYLWPAVYVRASTRRRCRVRHSYGTSRNLVRIPDFSNWTSNIWSTVWNAMEMLRLES